MDNDREYLVELIHELFTHACYIDDYYNHMYISILEETQDFLIEEGRIK